VRALRVGMKTRLLSLIGSIILLGTACTAAPDDEAAADEGAVSASDAITGRVATGAKLVTTTRVNFRAQPSLASRVLTVLATGTPVTVVDGDGVAGFYQVEYGDERGWIYVVYLSASDDGEQPRGGGAESGSCYDATVARKLVSASLDVDGEPSGGYCYRGVKDHMEQAGVHVRSALPAQYQGSAYMFATWAKRNPADLAALGFAPSIAGLANVPNGSVLVWRPGQCGYSAEHGHIEIAVGGGRACSDFCGNIKRGCGMPDIYVPVRGGCQ